MEAVYFLSSSVSMLRVEFRGLGALDVIPRHLGEAVGMADPRTHGADAFVASLLAPVRSGVILLRCDVASIARELHLGLRGRDRTLALNALLSEDAKGVLVWLSREARERASAHSTRLEGLGPIREHWVGRAIDTADLLESLAAQADLGVPA